MFSKLISLLALPAVLAAQQAGQSPYRPISLADAVRLAQENNVSAITAANNIRSATNNIRSARAQLYPSLSASLGQSKSSGERLGQTGTLVGYTSAWTYTTGLRANVTLYDGGKTFADVRARRADLAAQEAGQVTTQFSLALNVKLEYNLALAANEQAAAARAQLELAQQELDVTIARVNAGAANIADSLNAVVTLGNAQLAILNAQQSLRTAAAGLTHLVGTPYLVTATPSDTVDRTMAAIDSAAILQMALDGPSIRQEEATLLSANAAQRSAKAQYFPTISGNFSYGGNGTANPYGLGGTNPFPYSRTVGLTASYNIFNGYSRENGVASAQIAVDNAQAQLKDLRLAAQQTIITQLGLLQVADAKLRVQQISVRASEEALRVNQQRYALGAGTFVDVLTSQSNLIIARQNLIQARFDYRNARAQIEAVIGRDLP